MSDVWVNLILGSSSSSDNLSDSHFSPLAVRLLLSFLFLFSSPVLKKLSVCVFLFSFSHSLPSSAHPPPLFTWLRLIYQKILIGGLYMKGSNSNYSVYSHSHNLDRSPLPYFKTG